MIINQHPGKIPDGVGRIIVSDRATVIKGDNERNQANPSRNSVSDRRGKNPELSEIRWVG